MKIVFWLSLFFLYYIYDGYLRLLFLLKLMKYNFFFVNKGDNFSPKISVVITVYNEEKSIQARILNLLECEYPPELMEIIVASDGSTDETDSILETMNLPNLNLFRPENRVGKTDTQNRAILKAEGDILIFTDADTRFSKKFLKKIVAPFRDDRVGGVDGHLLFIIDPDSGISKSQNFYWNYELRLRELESQTGILAVASGACLAVRRDCFKPIEAEYGEDCIIPMDVVLSGKKMVHASDAIAYDKMESDPSGEFKSRVRMTVRNLKGTFSRTSLLNPFKHFDYAFSLWSHKILRWFSPFLILIVIQTTVLLAQAYNFYFFILIFIIMFIFLALIGIIAEHQKYQIPYVKSIYSFSLANLGFFIGIIKTVAGKKITAYRQS